MTYGLGIMLREGLLFASDSRTNAGVDQIASVKKLSSFVVPNERAIVILSAGNLATTQAVVAGLQAAFQSGAANDMAALPHFFAVAQAVGDGLRAVLARDGEHVRPHGSPDASFIVGGQISAEQPRLFQIYSAGNFVEASARTPFVQIGETKYGKPILDRGLSYETPLAEAAKLAVLSFDATIRSNLSVAPPIDLLRYQAGSLSTEQRLKLDAKHPYLQQLQAGYSDGLTALVAQLPLPPES